MVTARVITGYGKGSGYDIPWGYMQPLYYNGYFYVYVWALSNHLYRIDASTGAREIFFSGNSNTYGRSSIIYGNQIISTNWARPGQLLRINKNTGSLVNPAVLLPFKPFAITSYNGKSYVIKLNPAGRYFGDVDGVAIYSVDARGNVAKVSGDGRGSGPGFAGIRDLAGHNGALYLTNLTQDNVFKVDPTSGDRTIFAR